ncbi:hypothetical protein ACFFX1_39130 [Dactylosporangium sucinum]|uniref:Uncharacterized protein n=1 Tax=Dactylosporangium sucinum TaxID=1424081 RepID=A0A917T0H5_9ACTN|nr:hypothetical protein [Dactylosporangium sucinum]GGM03856.1 hypothetical protein GCM10007977_001500 [Dactylosporangium sucinum]
MVDVVAPDGGALRRVASSYLDAADRLQTYAGKLRLLKITPGLLDAGSSLKAQWENRIKEYVTFIEDLRYAVYWTGQNLVTIAQKYETSEELNQDDAQRVDELIQALSTKFPGVTKLVGGDGLDPTKGAAP